MNKLNQKGGISPLLIPLILSLLVVIGVSVAAFIYYGKYVDQRDNVDAKVETAVEIAESEQKTKLEAEFTEKEKVPNRTYTSPSVYGTVKLVFPKTWSGYVVDSGSSLDYVGHPEYVPSKGINYALRMNVSDKKFANEVKSYEALVKKGDLKAVSITVSGTTGTRLDGLLKKDQEGTLVLFPLRDKTLKVWTENKDYKADFENVLKNLTFVP
ncbi:hypothetical protein KBD20_01280 [Candidatus Saccharibacteria bacterium]|nr:hypothetical protein [Candidatus Saccharibacteria bacterium]